MLVLWCKYSHNDKYSSIQRISFYIFKYLHFQINSFLPHKLSFCLQNHTNNNKYAIFAISFKHFASHFMVFPEISLSLHGFSIGNRFAGTKIYMILLLFILYKVPDDTKSSVIYNLNYICKKTNLFH